MNDGDDRASPDQSVPFESLWAALLDEAVEAVIVLDGAGHVVQANSRALTLLGFTPGEVRSLLLPELVAAPPPSPVVSVYATAGDAPPRRRHMLRRRDGQAVPVDVSLRPIEAGQIAHLYLAVIHDLTAIEREMSPNFAVALAHELRTPLTTILGSSDLLLNAWTRLGDEARRKGVERLHSGARRLDLLVRDLLLVVGLEEGKLAVHAARTPLAPLLEQAVYEASAVHPNLNLRARGLRAAPEVWADPDRVVQVLVHLLDNAALHGQGLGPPELRVERRRDHVEVRVTDRGPGLPLEGRERLFTRFGKLDYSSHGGRVGTGIGLYICRLLVTAMGGDIGVESTRGKGASFWFTLPLPAAVEDRNA